MSELRPSVTIGQTQHELRPANSDNSNSRQELSTGRFPPKFTGMKVSIRTRLLLWLLAATLPILVAGFVITNRVSERLSDNAAEQLENLATVEALHLQSVLAEVEISGRALASNDELIRSLEQPSSVPAPAPMSGDLDVSADRLLEGSAAVGNEISGARIVDRSGRVRGQSMSFRWTDGWSAAADEAMERRRPVFGTVYPSENGARLSMALPVVTSDGSVVGALLLENSFDPLIVTLNSYEEVGRTTEAVLVQRLSETEVQAITIRRFDRDSAFSSVYSPSSPIPSVRSLQSNDVTILEERDYRGVETIAAVTAIKPVGWGLAVKIDKSEALELSREISWYVVAASIATTVIVLVSWLTFVRPLGRRLQRTADSSYRVADGEYDSRIGDEGNDEIGDVSRAIDRLASDLQLDIAAREEAEGRLRFQATHDDLTGLINRQHASSQIRSLSRDDVFSLLFIDLDRFKIVNDTFGHAIGDEVLVTIANRLRPKLPTKATLSRWGGDEFLVILPDTTEDERKDVESSLRHALNEPISTAAGPQTIGMSIGGATSTDGDLGVDVLAAADAEMFKMKRFQASAKTVPAEVIRMAETAFVRRTDRAALSTRRSRAR